MCVGGKTAENSKIHDFIVEGKKQQNKHVPVLALVLRVYSHCGKQLYLSIYFSIWSCFLYSVEFSIVYSRVFVHAIHYECMCNL